MKAQISEGFGSEWLLLHREEKTNSSPYTGKEGVAIILFPETDLPSFLAVKKLYESLPPDDPIKEKLATIIHRIQQEHQDIMGAGTWEKQ